MASNSISFNGFCGSNCFNSSNISHGSNVQAMGAMALLQICDGSFTCKDYNTHRAHPSSRFPLRRAHPGPGPHIKQAQQPSHRQVMFGSLCFSNAVQDLSLPTETKVESGTSQSKSGTCVNLSKRGGPPALSPPGQMCE